MTAMRHFSGRAIARVLRNCLTYSQPVYIELPRDILEQGLDQCLG